MSCYNGRKLSGVQPKRRSFGAKQLKPIESPWLWVIGILSSAVALFMIKVNAPAFDVLDPGVQPIGQGGHAAATAVAPGSSEVVFIPYGPYVVGAICIAALLINLLRRALRVRERW